MITKCYIKVKAFNYKTLENVSDYCLNELNNIDSITGSLIRLPTQVKKITLIKSPHVHKKSREQFEVKKHIRLLTLRGPKPLLEHFIKTKIENNKNSFYYRLQWQV